MKRIKDTTNGFETYSDRFDCRNVEEAVASFPEGVVRSNDLYEIVAMVIVHSHESEAVAKVKQAPVLYAHARHKNILKYSKLISR